MDSLACHGPDADRRPPPEPPRPAESPSERRPRSAGTLPARAVRRFGVIDVLRFFGLARRGVPRPVVGPKAFVRWWQRLRAAVVLAAVVAGLGMASAAVVGVIVLGAGFLLEQAIS